MDGAGGGEVSRRPARRRGAGISEGCRPRPTIDRRPAGARQFPVGKRSDGRGRVHAPGSPRHRQPERRGAPRPRAALLEHEPRAVRRTALQGARHGTRRQAGPGRLLHGTPALRGRPGPCRRARKVQRPGASPVGAAAAGSAGLWKREETGSAPDPRSADRGEAAQRGSPCGESPHAARRRQGRGRARAGTRGREGGQYASQRALHGRPGRVGGGQARRCGEGVRRSRTPLPSCGGRPIAALAPPVGPWRGRRRPDCRA